MLLSVIIPTLNGAGTLPLVFRCLELQTRPTSRFEVIVVDDGSCDNTAALLRQYHPDFALTVITHKSCLGRSTARNSAFLKCSGDVLVFLDADTLPAPEWLDSYAQAFTDHREEVIVGGHNYIHIPEGTEPSQWLALRLGLADSTALRLKDFGALHSLSRPGQWQYANGTLSRRELEVPHICRLFPESLVCAYSFITSNAAVRRTAFERTRGFDPFIRRGQDTELGLQLWEAACRFRCIAGADTYHLYTPSADRHLKSSEQLAYFYRHPYRLVAAMMLRRPGDSIFELLCRNNATNMDEEAVRRLAGHYIEFRYSRSEIESYLAPLTAGHPLSVKRALDEANRAGVVTGWKDEAPLFDLCLTTNWIRDRYLADAERGDQPRVRRYLAKWRVEVNPAVLRGLPEDTVWTLPVPANCNGELHFTDWDPPRLQDHLDLDGGVLRDVPVRSTLGSMSFKFSVNVPTDLNPSRRINTELQSLSEATVESLQKLLDRIGHCPGGDPAEEVRRIYEWMSRYVLHRCNTFPDSFILESGYGNEYQRAKLFAQLCCMAGIDARVEIGTILPFGDLPRLNFEVRRVTGCSNPLSQIWVAVQMPGAALLEVEFGERYRSWTHLQSSSGYRLKTAASSFFTEHPRYWNSEAQCWREVAVPAIFTMSTRLGRSRAGGRVMRMAHAS